MSEKVGERRKKEGKRETEGEGGDNIPGEGGDPAFSPIPRLLLPPVPHRHMKTGPADQRRERLPPYVMEKRREGGKRRKKKKQEKGKRKKQRKKFLLAHSMGIE